MNDKLNSGLLVLMSAVMCFSMEVTIVDATEQLAAGVSPIPFDGSGYELQNDVPKARIGEAQQSAEGNVVQYGYVNGKLCALWDANGVQRWVEVNGPELVQAVANTAAVPTITPTAVSGNMTNEVTIYKFLTGVLGLNNAAACGILANIYSESGFNPQCSCVDTNGLISFGICQWNGGRFAALQNYCTAKGYDYTSLMAQLLYLRYELSSSEAEAFNKVRMVDNSQQGAFIAGYTWASTYERCDSRYYASRAALARDVYWPRYMGGTAFSGTGVYTELDMAAAAAGYAAPMPVTPQYSLVPDANGNMSAVIVGRGVTDLSATDARINYRLNNPSGQAVSAVSFTLYDENGNVLTTFGTTPEMPASVLSMENGFQLSGCFSTLAPETTYKYRFTALTADGQVTSEMYSFTTPAATADQSGANNGGQKPTQNTDSSNPGSGSGTTQNTNNGNTNTGGTDTQSHSDGNTGSQDTAGNGTSLPTPPVDDTDKGSSSPSESEATLQTTASIPSSGGGALMVEPPKQEEEPIQLQSAEPYIIARQEDPAALEDPDVFLQAAEGAAVYEPMEAGIEN